MWVLIELGGAALDEFNGRAATPAFQPWFVAVNLWLVDVDGSPDVCQLPEIRKLFGGVVNAPPGAGEAAFCRNGQIVHAAIIGSGEDPDRYYFNAREFLSSPGVE